MTSMTSISIGFSLLDSVSIGFSLFFCRPLDKTTAFGRCKNIISPFMSRGGDQYGWYRMSCQMPEVNILKSINDTLGFVLKF